MNSMLMPDTQGPSELRQGQGLSRMVKVWPQISFWILQENITWENT